MIRGILDREDIPKEWRALICSHTIDEKHMHMAPKPLDWGSETLMTAMHITMQWCWCRGFEPKALKTCTECEELKPNNFAHPGRCCTDKGAYHVCWDCLNKEGGRDKCPCDTCQAHEFKFGIPVKDSLWYARNNRVIPPPAHFVIIDPDAEDLLDFDF